MKTKWPVRNAAQRKFTRKNAAGASGPDSSVLARSISLACGAAIDSNPVRDRPVSASVMQGKSKMASEWFVRGGGKVYGPLDDARLRKLAAEGKIDETTDVAKQPGGPWHPAFRVRGLFPPPAQSNDSRRSLAHETDSSLNSGPPGAACGVARTDDTVAERFADASDSVQMFSRPNWLARSSTKITLAAACTFLLLAGVLVPVLTGGVPFLPTRSRVLGSVFIVQANGESVRLGLTDVFVVPSDGVTDQILSELKNALEDLRRAESSIDYHSRPSPVDRAFSSPAVALQHRSRMSMEATSEKRDALARVGGILAELTAEALSETKTDADGEFEVQLPNLRPTSVVAYASRKIGAFSEHYVWVVPSDEVKREQPRLFLSNDNRLK